MKLATIAALMLVLGATACGGSSSSSDTTSTTTTTESTTTSPGAGSGAGGRLSAAEWSSLQADAAQARSVNQAAITQFKKCRVEVSKSYSNQQIADQLYISLNTTKTHVKNILGRLQVENRTQAAARARELGIL